MIVFVVLLLFVAVLFVLSVLLDSLKNKIEERDREKQRWERQIQEQIRREREGTEKQRAARRAEIKAMDEKSRAATAAPRAAISKPAASKAAAPKPGYSELDKERVSIGQVAVSQGPWLKWLPWNHTSQDQRWRILRAFSEKIWIVSYCPADQTAVIHGESGFKYLVSAESCECPDFSKRQLPCKHMYFLAIAQYQGTIPERKYVEAHTVETYAQAHERHMTAAKLTAIYHFQQESPYQEILSYVVDHDGASRREIFDYFSVMDPRYIRKALDKMVEQGSLIAEKPKNVYIYHAVQVTREQLNSYYFPQEK